MNASKTDTRLGLAITLAVAAFLIGPVVLSVLAGLTKNYFVGLSSGLTLRWVGQVWALYADTIWRSFRPEEHTSELQSLMRISYAVFCLNKNMKGNIEI